MTYLIVTILVLLIVWPIKEKKRKVNFRCEIRTETEDAVFWKLAGEFASFDDAKQFCTKVKTTSGSLCRVIDKSRSEVVFVT